MSQLVSLLAHEGIHHKTVFEAVMHVLSQWVFIIAASLLVALSAIWLADRSQSKKKDTPE